jgi:hypothetical protein
MTDYPVFYEGGIQVLPGDVIQGIAPQFGNKIFSAVVLWTQRSDHPSKFGNIFARLCIPIKMPSDKKVISTTFLIENLKLIHRPEPME